MMKPPPRILTALEWLASAPQASDNQAPAKRVYAAELLAERFGRVLAHGLRHGVKIRQGVRGRETYVTLLLEVGLQPDGLGLCLAVIPGAGVLRGRLTGQLYA